MRDIKGISRGLTMGEGRLTIGITQGDINGIGWEVILKTFADTRMCEICTPVIYGSKRAAEHYRTTISELENISFNICRTVDDVRRGCVNLVECGDRETAIEPGRASAAAGKAAADALLRAVADLREGRIAAVVTAPIDKETIHGEQFDCTGHTEFFGREFGAEPMMIMCSDRLKVGLVTVHIPVSQVSADITREKIVSRLTQLRSTLKQDFGIVEPRIAVLSLNPHNGDGGLFGSEEEQTIRPAVAEAYGNGILAFGPFAADGLFAGGHYASYDAVLAMYHDQGLIPFKTVSPDGVNFTAGLPVIRTSPDHGVAYDIAGKDMADASSMRNAVFAAVDIARAREAWREWSADPLQRFEREKGRDVSVNDLPQTEPEE